MIDADARNLPPREAEKRQNSVPRPVEIARQNVNGKKVLILMSVKEIDAAISRLPAGEVTELKASMAEHHALVWDQQIEDDLAAGRLDRILAEVDQEYAAALAKPL